MASVMWCSFLPFLSFPSCRRKTENCIISTTTTPSAISSVVRILASHLILDQRVTRVRISDRATISDFVFLH